MALLPKLQPAGFSNTGATPSLLAMSNTQTKPSTKITTTTPMTINKTPTTTPTGATVGTHVGNISNNPAYAPVGQMITRESLQASIDANNPKTAYIKASGLPTASTDYDKAITPKTTSGLISTNTANTANKITPTVGTNAPLGNVKNADGTYSSGSSINTTSTTQNNATTPNTTPTNAPVTAPAVPPAPKDSLFNTLVGNLATTAGGNQAIANRAADISADYGKQIADVGMQGGAYRAGALSTGTAPVGEGNAAINAQATAARQQALAQGQSAALQGTAQQLTGQQQTANAYNQAAGLVSPQLAQYGQTFYQPENAANVAGSVGVQPSDPFYQTLQTYAQMAATGQSGSIPSSITSNPALAAQLQNMAKAINPNYNTAIAGAQGNVLGSLTEQKNSIQSTANGAENNLQLAINLANQSGINKNIAAVNAFEQLLGSNFTTSPVYQTFQSQVNSVEKAYTDMGINPNVDWGRISVNQLENLKANLPKNIANITGGIDQQISTITNQSTQTNTSTGLFGW